MRAILNGVEGGVEKLLLGQDATWYLVLLNKDGSAINLTADTVTLQIYDRSDRKNAATVSVTATLTTAAAGYCTITISHTNASLLTAGKQYYAFIKRSHSSALSWASKPTLVTAG